MSASATTTVMVTDEMMPPVLEVDAGGGVQGDLHGCSLIAGVPDGSVLQTKINQNAEKRVRTCEECWARCRWWLGCV